MRLSFFLQGTNPIESCTTIPLLCPGLHDSRTPKVVADLGMPPHKPCRVYTRRAAGAVPHFLCRASARGKISQCVQCRVFELSQDTSRHYRPQALRSGPFVFSRLRGLLVLLVVCPRSPSERIANISSQGLSFSCWSRLIRGTLTTSL